MGKKLKDIRGIGMVAVGIVAVCFFIYGCYWAAKTMSYNIFYEDMVRASISEMVKPESLN